MTLKEYLKKTYSPTSVDGYESIIKRYKLVLGDKAENANYNDVLDYIGLLREQSLHPKTLRNNLFAIKIYYSYLVSIGKRNDHPCRYLKLKDQINRQIQLESLYSKEELGNLYENWQSNTPLHQTRDKIIISLLVYQALTVLEITQIKLSDINLEEGTVKINGHVKNKERTLSLKSKQILLFHNYLIKEYKQYSNRQKTNNLNPLFLLSKNGKPLCVGSINDMVNQRKYTHTYYTPLKIRQSVIACLVKENHDIRIVQEFAGHRSVSSTEAYKQTGLEELKSAIEKLHPLQ
jgi:integrase/recombinase XerD